MDRRTTRRRTVLAGVGSGALGLSGGCLRRVRAVTGWQSSDRVQLEIKTLPADADPSALRLARTVAEWFGAAGIDVNVVPMAKEELLRQVLLRNEFELFVTRLPPRFRNPDALYTLLHSKFADAPGWQNPFGYANLGVNDLLESQRRTGGARRREALAELQLAVARTQPFTMLGFPDDIRAARTGVFTNWSEVDLESPPGYLLLGPDPAGETAEGNGDLRMAVTDPRATKNLNPLSVEFRQNGVVTGLLYDPLGHVVDGDPQPWLADAWGFRKEDPPVARVDLREGESWHDGEALTAGDVAFTYEFLADTTLGTRADEEAPVPSPRFYGRDLLVETVRAVDETTVEFRFGDVDPGVAVRAFTVPILPEHVWQDRTDPVEVAGITVGTVTEALVTNNIPPVGSGPLRFVRNTPEEALVLERAGEHFLHRDDVSLSGLAASVGTVPFARLTVRVVGSDVTAVDMVSGGEAVLTGTSVSPKLVPRVGRSPNLDLVVDRSETPYLLGYNTRKQHLNNPVFRTTLARLIDAEYLVDRVHEGYGHPAAGPLWGTRWYPESLEWSDGNPATPFLGRNGEVDVERARAAFRDAGYRYDDGRLIGGNT